MATAKSSDNSQSSESQIIAQLVRKHHIKRLQNFIPSVHLSESSNKLLQDPIVSDGKVLVAAAVQVLCSSKDVEVEPPDYIYYPDQWYQYQEPCAARISCNAYSTYVQLFTIDSESMVLLCQLIVQSKNHKGLEFHFITPTLLIFWGENHRLALHFLSEMDGLHFEGVLAHITNHLYSKRDLRKIRNLDDFVATFDGVEEWKRKVIHDKRGKHHDQQAIALKLHEEHHHAQNSDEHQDRHHDNQHRQSHHNKSDTHYNDEQFESGLSKTPQRPKQPLARRISFSSAERDDTSHHQGNQFVQFETPKKSVPVEYPTIARRVLETSSEEGSSTTIEWCPPEYLQEEQEAFHKHTHSKGMKKKLMEMFHMKKKKKDKKKVVDGEHHNLRVSEPDENAKRKKGLLIKTDEGNEEHVHGEIGKHGTKSFREEGKKHRSVAKGRFGHEHNDESPKHAPPHGHDNGMMDKLRSKPKGFTKFVRLVYPMGTHGPGETHKAKHGYEKVKKHHGETEKQDSKHHHAPHVHHEEVQNVHKIHEKHHHGKKMKHVGSALVKPVYKLVVDPQFKQHERVKEE